MTRSGLAPRPCGHPRQSPGRDCTPLSTLRRPTHPPAQVQRLIVSYDTISMGHEGVCATQSGIDVHRSILDQLCVSACRTQQGWADTAALPADMAGCLYH